MSNPFVGSGSLLAERDRRRRENVRVGVYAVLVTASIFLAGLLIQGCRRHGPAGDAGDAQAAEAPANPASPVLVTEEKQPETNAAAPRETAAATPLPSPAPATSTAAAPMPRAMTETPAPTVPATEALYVIKPGDSLIRIAKAHATTVAAIKAANGLKSDRIIAGKKLKLPQAAVPAVPGTTATQS